MRINKVGWIKLYRQLLINDLWLDRPFARGQAWIDLLLLYDHRNHFLQISKRELARRWGWSVSKVTHFLDQLSGEGSLIQEVKHNKTVLLIAKYELFQKVLYQNQTVSSAYKQQSPDLFKKRNKNKKESDFVSDFVTDTSESSKSVTGDFTKQLLKFWESKT